MQEEQFEQAERYVHGTMSSEERAQFEALLHTDKTLAATVATYRAIEDDMRGYGQETALKATLQRLGTAAVAGTPHSAMAPPPAPNRTPGRWATIAAAAAILVAVVTTGLWYATRPADTAATGMATHEKKTGATLPAGDSPAVVETPPAPAATPRADTPKSTVPVTLKSKNTGGTAALFDRHFVPDAPPDDAPPVLLRGPACI